MAKIHLDKYYTPPDLAKYIVDKTREIIGEENITEYLEPSAGSGVFLDYLDELNLPYSAYDIEPEDDKGRIIKQDFLSLDLEYKKGRCVIGNPPYGNMMKLAEQFYKKSIKLSDYISFILPVSQLNNKIKLFDFDLIYSKDLNIKEYSSKKIYCCFNIYKRPKNNLNKKPNYKLKDVEIKTSHRKANPPKTHFLTKDIFDYDIRICAWGSSIGKLCDYEGQYSTEMCIKIKNDKYKNNIMKLLINTNWTEVYPMIGTPHISLWHIYKYIKEQIPEIN